MKRWLMTCIALLICMPLVYAYDTQIKVTTEPNTFVMVRVFEAGNPTNLLESVLDRRVDFNNQVTITHTSEKPTLDIVVYIKEKPNGNAKYYKKYESIRAGALFEVSLPDNATAPSLPLAAEGNVTPSNTTNQTTPMNNTNYTTETAATALTGNAVQGSNVLGGVQWYYLVAGAFLAIALLAGGLIIKKRQASRTPMMPKDPPGKDKDPTELEKKLEETQARLDQATKEISRIKNEDQIKQLQKNIEAEQEQLRKLQQGFS